MKRINVLLLATLLSCFAINANAQIKFGAKAALNFNNYKTENLSLKNSTGWQAGVMARFKLPIVGLGVQPEVLYTHKSSKINDESTRTSYLQIPLNVLYTIGLSKAEVFVTAGPSFSYAVDFKKGGSDTFDKFDWGLGIGAGLDIGKIHAGVRYDWGMQNVAKNDGVNVKNNAFSIFAGFFF